MAKKIASIFSTRSVLLFVLLLLFPFKINAQKDPNNWLIWTTLPDIPNQLGLGGAFAGTSNGVVILAGGSNFENPIWEGGEKGFHDKIYVLEEKGEEQYQWNLAGNLPYKVAHGASVNIPDGILCLGGTNGNQKYDEVFLLRWDPQSRSITIDRNFPSLPKPISYLSAEKIGNKIYVAGGWGKQSAQEAGMKNFWVLDLTDRSNSEVFGWKELDPWPGPARFGAVLKAQNNGENECLYLFSGKKGPQTYLKDSYQYDPAERDINNRWQTKAEMPRAAMVAPSTTFGQTHIMIFSGSDGHDVEHLLKLRDEYKFVKDVLAYHTITDTWIKVSEMPQGLVTSQIVNWRGQWVIPGGEIGPSIRTSKVFAAEPGNIVQQSHFHWLDYVTLSLYLLFMVYMGFYFSSKKIDTTENYFLGGKRIPYWAAGLSIMATSVSALGFMAAPSKSYATNWAYFAGVPTWFIVVPIVIWAFIPFFYKLNVTSAYEYLEARFNVVARLIAASLYCLFQIAGRMAIVLYLPGIAMAATTGLDVYFAILLMGILSTTYTILGGMEAVIWTDVLQGIIIFGGALFCILIAIFGIDGGFIHFFDTAWSQGKFEMGMGEFNWDYTTAALWVVVIGNIFNRLSTYGGDQSIVQRYMSTSNIEQAKRATWTSIIFLIPWAVIVFGLGTAMFVFYQQNPQQLNPSVNADGIVPLFISQNVPIGVSGLIIAGVFAAAMSSLDSAMHSTATVIVKDFYERFFPETNEGNQLKLAKWLIGFFGLIGTGISLLMVTQDFISIWDVFLEFTGIFIGIIAGLFLLGIFTDKANGTGAVIGVMGSTILLYIVKLNTNIHLLLYGGIGLVTCFLLGYLASLIIPGRTKTDGLTIYSIKANKNHEFV